MTHGPLIVGVLVALFVLIIFIALWRRGTTLDPVEARLKQYGGSAEAADEVPDRRALTRRKRSLRSAAGLGGGIAATLTRADLPITANEFVLIVLGLTLTGFALGWLRGSIFLGLALAAVGAFVPFVYVSTKASKRRDAFTRQLPEVLTLIIGALRAGHGIAQSLSMVVERLPKPASVEFERAQRAVNLGLPLTKALNDMADRIDSDDLYLVVTAMSVQQELGGNLAQTLTTIADTVRERIRIKREISVFTSQQRMTGYILSGLPVFLAIVLNSINPTFMSGLWAPGIGRILIVLAVIMQVMGFLVIRKIVAIEV